MASMEGIVMNIRSSQVRSVLKAITWRLVASIDTLVLVWLVTGSFEAGLAIGGIEVITKIAIYYAHERLWSRVEIKLVRKVLDKLTPDDTKII